MRDNVTGGIGRRRYRCCRTELETRIEGTRQNKSQRYFQSRTIACYTRERVKREEKGNPTMPNHLSLYALATAILEPSFMIRCTTRILVHDLTHPYSPRSQNNHATSPNVATRLYTPLSHPYVSILFSHHCRFLPFLYNLRLRISK